jgi:hypothetical protein
MVIRKCELRNDWIVTIVYKEDMVYNDCKKLFETFGLAYANLENNFIFVDGEAILEQNLTPDHIIAIEAHEIGHFISDHKGQINKSLEEIEKEADWAGYQLLIKYKRKKAALILAKRFKDKYEIDITQFVTKPKHRHKIENYINEIKDV